MAVNALPVAFGLAALEILYLISVGPRRGRFMTLNGLGPPPPVGRGRQATFLLGILTIGLALVSPIEPLAEVLQSIHMVQHLLLTLIAPPLLLLGTPAWLLDPLLRPPLVQRLAYRLTRARPAFAIGNTTFLLWHLPIFYDAALQYRPVHILEHLTLLITAIMMWWPLTGRHPALPGLSSPLQMLYVFIQTLPGALLGIILGMAPVPLYSTYTSLSRNIGPSPLADQQIAGLIMWVGANLFWLAILTTVFFIWASREEDDLISEHSRKRLSHPR